MITRLVLLNSDIYAKADIELKNTDAIQLVGPNNIGKSTLIYALNFLFIIDGKRMIFSGQRSGDKSTIHHYFPSPNKSFLIFEVFKKRYYSILIKRSVDGDLEYYKINNEYKEELFINQDNQKLYSIREIQANHISNNIEITRFKDKREVFNFIYKTGKNNNAVVWLDSDVKSDGLSNNFSKVYKHLIYSKQINNEILKDSLIYADKRENSKITFKKQSQNDINRLLNYNDEIKIIRNIEKDFIDFKELTNEYKTINKLLGKLTFNFNSKYEIVSKQLLIDIKEKETEKDKYYNKIHEELTPLKNNFLQEKGGIEANLKRDKKELETFEEQKIKTLKIGNAETIPFFKQSYENKEKERKLIETKISQIENQELSVQDINLKIEENEKRLKLNKDKIDNYKNLLIHQISENKEAKELINSIFSDIITSLSKENIDKKINNFSKVMKIFDGAIKLPEDIKTKPIESIEELKKSINKLKKELKANKELLPIAKELEKNKSLLIDIQNEINEYQNNIKRIEQLPHLELNIKNILAKIKIETEKLKTIEKDIERIEKESKELNLKYLKIIEIVGDLNKRKEELRNWKDDIDEKGISEITNEDNVKLDVIYEDFKRFYKDRIQVKTKKDILFNNLKHRTNSVDANEEKLIEYIESELSVIDKKEKDIDNLLRTISASYSSQAKLLIANYNEFNSYVSNRFNRKLSKIKISDIDSLKIELVQKDSLMRDLNKIMEIQSLDHSQIQFDQSDNLDTLKKYLENATTINFSDLFDINLHLENKGKKKTVDLQHQIESDGTDKMIRLVIIMSIINRLIINEKDNRILIFIDELGTIDDENRIELLKFCKENNFLPISAALQTYDGFDKYYQIFRNEGKIIVSERNGNVMYRKKL